MKSDEFTTIPVLDEHADSRRFVDELRREARGNDYWFDLYCSIGDGRGQQFDFRRTRLPDVYAAKLQRQSERAKR